MNSGKSNLKRRIPNYLNPNESETPNRALHRTRHGIALLLQSTRLVDRVAELGSLGIMLSLQKKIRVRLPLIAGLMIVAIFFYLDTDTLTLFSR
jgi:hypothetical protein